MRQPASQRVEVAIGTLAEYIDCPAHAIRKRESTFSYRGVTLQQRFRSSEALNSLLGSSRSLKVTELSLEH
jgi:hypothetical protein